VRRRCAGASARAEASLLILLKSLPPAAAAPVPASVAAAKRETAKRSNLPEWPEAAPFPQ
jgi:hypothetical protein